MKLQVATTEGQNTFTAYGEGYVSVNAVRHTGNVLVLPNRLVTGWTRSTPETMSVADFALLADLDADIILLGTGSLARFPAPELRRPLVDRQKGLEVMDIAAACRTYNILISERRRVAAALVFS
jgi:uncharacterized protein